MRNGDNIFVELKNRFSMWIGITIFVFLLVFFSLIYISFSSVLEKDYLEKTEKFLIQSMSDVELKLSRIDGLVDASMNKYNRLKSNEEDAKYYNLSYLVSDIKKSSFVGMDSQLDVLILRNNVPVAYTGVTSWTDKFDRIAERLEERNNEIQKYHKNDEVYYTCMDNMVLYIRKLIDGADDCVLVVHIPSRLFAKPLYSSDNRFLDSINVYITFNNKDVLQLDMGNRTFSTAEEAMQVVEYEDGVMRDKNRLVAVQSMEGRTYSVVAYQNLKYLDPLKRWMIPVLILTFILTIILCILLLKRLIFDIIRPLEHLRQEMNEYVLNWRKKT